MRTLLVFCALAIALGVTTSATARLGQGVLHTPSVNLFAQPADLKWQPGPPSLPPGAMFVVLEGDPSKEGQFTLRLKVPAGYEVPPHSHAGVEHVTVLQGTFSMGEGADFSKAHATALGVGAFGMMVPNEDHFAFAGNTETIVQLHGVGPWVINYVNKEDDPRGKS
jgi:quercetin dioxygenase-like cupin family protein